MAEKTFDEYYKFTYLSSADGNHFEPKTSNRFFISMGDIPAAFNGGIRYPGNEGTAAKNNLLISLQSFSRPSNSVNIAEIDNFNSKFYLPGKGSTDKSISCSFIDFFSPHTDKISTTISTASIIYRWYELVHNQSTDAIGYKDYFTTDMHLFLLTPTGVVAEHWKYYEVWPTAVDYGALDYGSTEHMKINVTFKYERAKLIGEARDIEPGTEPNHIYQDKGAFRTGEDFGNNVADYR
jgi:hypothetical protein